MFRHRRKAYDRYSSDLGHQDFGVELAVLPGAEAVAPMSVAPEVVSVYPAAPCNVDGHALARETSAKKNASLLRLEDNLVHFPSGAVFAADGRTAYQESLWGGQLFFSPDIRLDKSTRFDWRIREDLGQIDRFEPVTAYCYTRCHWQFYHFFAEALSKYYYLTEVANPGDIERYLLGDVSTAGFLRQALELLDVDFTKLVEGKDITTPFVRFRQLYYPAHVYKENLGLRPSYKNGVHFKGVFSDYFEFLRDRFLRGLRRRGMSPVGNEKVYIARGSGGKGRGIANEDELIPRLEAEGFVCVDPGSMDFSEQVAALIEAREVVAPHGAALTHLMWMRPGCKFVELIGDGYDDPSFRVISGEKKNDYRLVVGSALDPEDHRSDYAIDVEVVMSMLA